MSSNGGGEAEDAGRAASARPLTAPELYRTLAKVIWLAAGVFILLWFLDAALNALLFLALAAILAMALNAPVVWMEQRGIPRLAGTIIACLTVAGILGLLGWLVVPRVVNEAVTLAQNVPGYASRLSNRAADLLSEYPQIERQVRNAADGGEMSQRLLPVLQRAVTRIGRYSLSVIGLFFLGVLLVLTVVYAVARPRPILSGYLSVFPPPLRDPAARAFARSSQVVTGWVWANVIVGGIEGIAAAIVLSWLNVPGALVWAALTFFAEMVPKLGPYLMSVPPILVALAVDPMTALWVLVFYVILQNIVENFVGTAIQGNRMKVHPASLLAAVFVLGSVFGIIGALVATPITGFIKAFYDEFYAARQPHIGEKDRRVEDMLTARLADEDTSAADKEG